MAGKTNTRQICVFKTKKALLEFMDDTRWEKEAMAWPHSPMSRIRINAKDYSEGTGDLATDAFYNLSPDEFQRLASAVMKAKTATISDHNRCVKHLERLQKLKGVGRSNGQSNGMDKVMELARQFAGSRNEVFSEAGQKMIDVLNEVSVPVDIPNDSLDAAIAEATAELEEVKSARELFSDVKILNYEKYINPENEEERRVTMLKVVYHPKMNYPYAFTVANGWGVPLITKKKGVMIKEGSVRFVDIVNLLVDEKSLFPMIERVKTFLQAMAVHGLANYFESINNPILFYNLTEEE